MARSQHHVGGLAVSAMLVAACGAAPATSADAGADATGPGVPFEPSPVALPDIPAFEAVVTAYGAIPDDSLDDTAAIQAGLDAVAAAGGGTLVFPAGRFDLAIDPAINRALTLHARLRLEARPAGGATIRLADNQLIYESIMATASYETRLDDVELVGLTFDANSERNAVLSADETNGELGNPTFRYVLRTFRGDRVRVSNCTFVNLDNGNTLSFNGDDLHDVTVEDSRFLGVGGLRVDHDHSTIYSFARRVRIVNNEFRGRNGPGTLGARTAIETHDSDVLVQGNTVHGYLQGANIVGRTTGPASQLYRDNTLTGVSTGLNLWPLAGAGVPGQPPAFAALRIIGNDIQVDADAWWASPAMVTRSPAGIHLEQVVDLPGIAFGSLDWLEIVDNEIRFTTFAGDNVDADFTSAGIDLHGEGLRLGRVEIRNNVIRDTPGPCVLVGALVVTAEVSIIEANTLTDCGRSARLVGVQDDVGRAGVVIAGESRNLRVASNTIVATPAVASLQIGVVAASRCLGDCVVSANAVMNVPVAVNLAGAGWAQTQP